MRPDLTVAIAIRLFTDVIKASDNDPTPYPLAFIAGKHAGSAAAHGLSTMTPDEIKDLTICKLEEISPSVVLDFCDKILRKTMVTPKK